MASSATDVFVSYKAEDRARLKPLVAALETEGFTVWWDAHIGGGTDWREEIQQHLDTARCVIVAWSERSVGPEGQFVRDEATRAKRRGSYVPIRLADVEPPLGFGEVQAIDFVGWKGKRSDPRFVALVDAVNAHLTGEAPVDRRTAVAQPKLSRRTAVAGGIGALAVAGVSGWGLLKPGGAAASERIAVMSFSNLSGDPGQAYFSDGIAEELRGALSRVGMQVIGKASCDAVKDLEIPAAAAKLSVANILTGSVRRSPETIRVGAQLVGGKDGVQKWAQNYDRAPGDAIKIQSDIAEEVASALSVALGAAKKAALTLGGTADGAALDLFLRAAALDRDDDSEGAMLKIIALTEAALARDPNYGNAHLQEAKTQASYAAQFEISAVNLAARLTRAEQSARRAAALMPGSGLPAARLALISGIRLDFRLAVHTLQQAIASNPYDGNVLLSAIFPLALLSDRVQTLQLADRTIGLDPLNADAYFMRGVCLYAMRRYADAVVAYGRALALAPQRVRPRYWIAFCEILLNRPGDARAALVSVPVDNPGRMVSEGLLAARAGNRARAYAVIARFRGIAGDQTSYFCGQIYAQLGDTDHAFLTLNKAVEIRDPGLQFLKRDPFLDPVRRDTRFAALLERLRFPT